MAANRAGGGPRSAATSWLLFSVVETVANLGDDLARIQKVRASERETVIEEHAAVGDVDPLHVDGETFPKALADSKIKRRVRLEVVIGVRRRIAIGEAGSVVDVCGNVAAPGQRVLPAEVQRVALVVIEQAEAVAERKVGKPAVDVAEAEGQLIGVGQVELQAILDARRANRQFPAVDARALNGDGKENIGIVQIVVIEKVFRAGEKIVGVDGPALEGNGDAELVFFVAFAVERNEPQVFLVDQGKEGAGGSDERRRLVEMTVEAAENPA